MQELPCYRACNELREKTNKMAREYIKLPNGTLQEIDRARVREFASVECVKKAIADGDLQPGDAWATICHTTPITEDIAAEVYRILSYVPETTNSTDNKLLNHCDLTAEMEEIAKRAMCCDFQAYVETAGVAITDRVCCSDYNTCVGSMQSAINTLEGKPGLDCVGTVTSITVNGGSYTPASGIVSLPNYPPDLSSCVGLSCTGTVTSVSVNGASYTPASGVVSLPNYPPDLSSCPGLSCTGTVVASDLTPLSNAISNLGTCPGLSCTGTVVASDIASFITMADVNACGYTTCQGTVTSITVNGLSYTPSAGIVSLPNYPPDLSSCAGLSCIGTLTESDLTPLSTAISNLGTCPGLSCTGTVVASDISDMATQTWVNNCGFSKATFSLSGNVLTITTA